jgi:hypothetical protein
MRLSETGKPGSKAERDALDEADTCVIPGVPNSVAVPFLHGLDDVRNGRFVDGDAVLAESRALLGRYRRNKRKT